MRAFPTTVPGQTAEAGKSMRIVSNQIHYSMLSRGLEKQTVKYCMDHGMAVLAYRPLESGLLTGTLKPGTVFPDGDFRRNNAKFSDENIRRTGEFIRLLKLARRRQENQHRPACPALDCPAPRHHRRTRRRDECRTGCRKRPGGRHPSLGQGNGLHRQHPAPSITATETGPKNAPPHDSCPGRFRYFRKRDTITYRLLASSRPDKGNHYDHGIPQYRKYRSESFLPSHSVHGRPAAGCGAKPTATTPFPPSVRHMIWV